MKKIFLIFNILHIFIGCSQNKSTTMKKNETPQEKQINYVVDLTLKTPHELYINDILVASESRGSNSAKEVNPYVLKNGKYKIKLKLFPYWQLNETKISVEDIKNSRVFFGNYIKNRTSDEIISYDADFPLKLTLPSEPIPYYEQEWEVEIKNLPYELEGWSNGQDLRTLDQKQLEKNVVSFHEMLRKVLNDGKGNEWSKLTSKRFNEALVYDYVSSEQAKIDLKENEDDVNQNCKNTMIPLEDYEMKLYADGKLATLKRKNHTKSFNNTDPMDLKNWSPLISKGKISGAADYSVLLYLPKNSNEFVIIRK